MAANGNVKGAEPLDFTKFQNVINGKLVDTKETRRTVNPSTFEELYPVPVSSQTDIDEAIEAAKKAQESWANVPWAERAQAVKDYADALEALSEDFVKQLVTEQGKPKAFAQGELADAVKWLRQFAEFPEPEDVLQDDDKKKVITRYTPLGVAVGIVPWNFPIQLSAGKIGAALITGNSFILKPSPFTPYGGLKLAELGQRFFPPGVFQALSGDDNLGPWLTAHPGVDKVSFTGSTATGKKVMESCAKTLKRVTLELGGNDPAIICADVNPAEVAPGVAFMALANSGQICIAIKRIFIHESVYDDVLKAMVAFVKSLKVGDGHEEGTFLGPINNQQQFERVKNLLEDIEKTQLNIATGTTKNVGEKGYFIQPTIIDNPPEDSRIVVEEPFGPVFPVLKWSDEEDVIKRANNTDMGLGASVWTRDPQQAERIGRRLKAGNVWINCHGEVQPNAPFGGHKQSGIGYEWGVGGLKAYCNAQSIYLKRSA
ncbi:hypothetical protein PFICI_15140 [Pestalotiopsis fici W106-1]|uniref:aldehyde dehydrogenase (NAD(+)) n=1 Tax=Pestalotiopsis fici (strain W106-1 / CGMCC3.15140) TaxID=1229662 RepID=W3WGZ9_PESFW|nr:uncharacterized protein PFICI_15140 [Pestalotiopsis fici W106-1]ETS73195.1 hypothetical protein PFICI_15140 [Pestalotiopsis fici W106-1]